MSKRTHNREDQRQRTEFIRSGQAARRGPGDPPPVGVLICTLRIDCEQAPGTTTDSHTLDHYYPVEDFPVLQNEPDNFRHAHFDCNSSRGKGDAERGLGEPMPAWW